MSEIDCNCSAWYTVTESGVERKPLCDHCERKRAEVVRNLQITALLTELVAAGVDDPRKDTGELRALRGALARVRLHSLAGRAAALLATMEETK